MTQDDAPQEFGGRGVVGAHPLLSKVPYIVDGVWNIWMIFEQWFFSKLLHLKQVFP